MDHASFFSEATLIEIGVYSSLAFALNRLHVHRVKATMIIKYMCSLFPASKNCFFHFDPLQSSE